MDSLIFILLNILKNAEKPLQIGKFMVYLNYGNVIYALRIAFRSAIFGGLYEKDRCIVNNGYYGMLCLGFML